MKSLAVLAFAPLAIVLALNLPAFAQDSETTSGGSSQPNGAAPSGGDGSGGAFSNGNASGSAAVTQQDPAVKAQAKQTDSEGEPLLPVFCPSGKCYQSAFDTDNSICDSGGKGAGPGREPCISASASAPNVAPYMQNGQKTQ